METFKDELLYFFTNNISDDSGIVKSTIDDMNEDVCKLVHYAIRGAIAEAYWTGRDDEKREED